VSGQKISEADLRLLEGDSLELLAQLPPESVDAVVTDPPYGIGIKGERWDSQAIHEAVATPGGPRMNSREAFEVWCSLWAAECLRVLKPGAHLLAFGSPRTAHRLGVGIEEAGLQLRDTLCWLYGTGIPKTQPDHRGRGTTLKPGYEPIILARRALEGKIEETIDRHGTGALEVDACRVGRRHPANVVLGHAPECGEGVCAPECPVALLDAGEGHMGSRNPSRFFYCPKPSRREREAGCEHLPHQHLDLFPQKLRPTSPSRNPPPTLKPLELMRWLVRLACPRGGLVLDPFCGSGSTGAAAALEGRRFLGIELSPEFSEIAAARIAHWAPGEGQVDRCPLGGRR